MMGVRYKETGWTYHAHWHAVLDSYNEHSEIMLCGIFCKRLSCNFFTMTPACTLYGNEVVKTTVNKHVFVWSRPGMYAKT